MAETARSKTQSAQCGNHEVAQAVLHVCKNEAAEDTQAKTPSGGGG